MFETKETDYVIPYSLYVSRLEQLEAALNQDKSLNRQTNIDVFYTDHDGREDSEFVPYGASIVDLNHNVLDDTDPNLNGSGYNSVMVIWEGEESTEIDNVHPWDVTLKNAKGVDRPSLDDSLKLEISNAIKSVKMLDLKKYFLHGGKEMLSRQLCLFSMHSNFFFLSLFQLTSIDIQITLQG